MKNTYITAYFPLLSIVLFSLSYAIYMEEQAMILLKRTGLYVGLLEFFSAVGIKLTLLLILFCVFFMLLSALKLLSDTIFQMALLFFSKDLAGEGIRKVRFVSFIYLVGSTISLVCTMSFLAITLVFFITTMIDFIFIVYQTSEHLTSLGLVGFVTIHTFIWSCIICTVGYTVLKLYNSLLASLPV